MRHLVDDFIFLPEDLERLNDYSSESGVDDEAADEEGTVTDILSGHASDDMTTYLV
jgi:hypothetical protein